MLPVGVLKDAGLEAGDEVVIRVVGRGRIAVERAEDVIDRYAREPAGRDLPARLPQRASGRVARLALDADC